MEKIDLIIEKINKLIQNNLFSDALNTYLFYLADVKNMSNHDAGVLYYNYALFLFEQNEYELSLLMFQSAYQLHYAREEIEDFINHAFILPNYEEFKECYDNNISLYNKNIILSNLPEYNELPLNFIPFAVDKYYIFDNVNKKFEGVLDITNEAIKSFTTVSFEDGFSDLVITEGWDFRLYKDLVLSQKNRIIYFISSDIIRSLCFLSIPNFTENFCGNMFFLDSIHTFQSFLHENTSVYLPKLYYGNNNSESKIKLAEILEIEHTYRLTKEGRNTSNVLLTIGIPSYNRGHRALDCILHLIQTEFDSEIEFIVSNNCSTDNTLGYDTIETLSDSRILYNKNIYGNCGTFNFNIVLNLSHGKYTCLLSDEDRIYLPNLSNLLTILRNNTGISLVRPNTNLFYTAEKSELFPCGEVAFDVIQFKLNYISGLIYKTSLYHSLNIHGWTQKYIKENSAVKFYPHLCFASIFALHGDYLESNLLFINEGIDENDGIAAPEFPNSEKTVILEYGTLEARIEQHYDFIKILNLFVNDISPSYYINAYKTLCCWTIQAVSLVKGKYLARNFDWNKIIDEALIACVNGIYELLITPTEKEYDSITEYIMQCNQFFLDLIT